MAAASTDFINFSLKGGSLSMVSGQNATDKTPMYDMPLISMFGVWGRAFFVLGFWVLAFFHWCFVPRSLSIGKMLFPQVTTRSPSHHLSCHIQVHCYSTFYQGLQIFDITQISVNIIIVLWMLSWAMDDSTNVGSPSSTMKEVIKFCHQGRQLSRCLNCFLDFK